MCSKQFKILVDKELQQHNYVTLSLIKKKLNLTKQTAIQEALSYRMQHKEFEILCFVKFEENNTIYSRYEVDSTVEERKTFFKYFLVLKNRKNQGRLTSDFFVQFLCIFRTSSFYFNTIVQTMIDLTKEMYTNALQNQIQRNLTLIPPNAIMKNGKKFLEINPTKSQPVLSQTASKGSLIVSEPSKKEPSQKSKTQISELPRKTEPKKQEPKQAEKPAKKKYLPAKKLQIQSDESEDIYVPEIFIDTLEKKPLHKNEPMQLQNHGNYKQNQAPTQPLTQKMQIQNHASQKTNHKGNSPGNNTNIDDEEDSMAEMMAMMNQIPKNKPSEKPSMGAKSLPAVKQKKLEFAKQEPTKSVASKQGNLFEWMKK